MAEASTVWFSFHLGCHRSVVSFPALKVSSLTQTIALTCGLVPCFSSSTSQRQVQSYQHSCPTPHPLQFPSFYQVLCGSFPLVRYSRMLSAGVLHALLCLKVYSWCIHGERCTPHPPTPLPSCSPLDILDYNVWKLSECKEWNVYSDLGSLKLPNRLYVKRSTQIYIRLSLQDKIWGSLSPLDAPYKTC